MSTISNKDLIEVLSKLYNHPTKVINLLEDIGIKSNVIKVPFGGAPPYDYWREIIRNIEGGLVENGVQKLEDAVLKDYPHNSALKNIKNSINKRQHYSKNTDNIPDHFDLFLAYNSKDISEVDYVAEFLKKEDLKPWFDQWYLQPGQQVHVTLEEALEKAKAIAIFIGNEGIGKWQILEMGAAFELFVSQDKPIIPIWLVESQKQAAPLFIRQNKGFTFSRQYDDQTIKEIAKYLKSKNK